MPKKEREVLRTVEVLTDKYSISDCGVRLLQVMSAPEARTMTVTDICAQAGISRDSFYRLFRQESFRQAYTELCRSMLLSAAAPASQALAAQAAAGDVSAIRMILELSAIYTGPNAQITITQAGDGKPTLADILRRKRPDK